MTVAAVILSATAAGAVAPTLGQPRVRRLADLAWSGGALPIVVVSPDDDGAVGAALVGSEALHAAATPAEAGPGGQMIRGAEAAIEAVHETSAILVWPARMTWVGPETITSLIEAHGTDPGTILQPAWHGDAGWPVLLPVALLASLRAVRADAGPEEIVEELAARASHRLVDVGDPGVALDVATAYPDLPPYEGPPDPPAGHRHEWGADVAAEAGLPEP